MTTTLLPGLLRAAGKNVGRGTTDVAIFETGTVTLPRHSRAGRHPAGRPPSDRRRSSPRWTPPCRAAAAPRRGRRGRRGRRRLVGRGAGPSLGRRRRGGPLRRRGARASRSPPPRSSSLPGTRAGAPSSSVAVTVVGHAGELHPTVCQAFGAAEAHRRGGDRPRPPDRAVDPPAAGADASRRTRSPRRTSRSSSTPRCPRPTSRRRCARVPASCSSRSGSSTSTPATRSARARSRWPTRCASARPTGP